MNIKTPGFTLDAFAQREMDLDRIKDCLLYILRNPGVKDNRWREAVRAEALVLGYRLETPARIGSNCRPGIDRGITYGGDMEDVF